MFWRLAPTIVLAIGLAPAAAKAQTNIDQGKSPGEIFANDCATCHKSARGLAKGRGSSELASFLTEHYTASKEQAAAMAAYVLGAGGGEPAQARGGPKTTPGKPEEPKTAARPGRPQAKPEEPGQPTAKLKPEEERKPPGRQPPASARNRPPVPEPSAASAEPAPSPAPVQESAPSPAPARSAAAPASPDNGETSPVQRDDIPD